VRGYGCLFESFEKYLLLGPLGSLKLQGHQIVRIRTLSLNGVPLPPGEASSELEGGQIGEDVMIEVPAQAGGIVTTDFKGFPDLMSGTAFPLHTRNRSYNFLPDSWIASHFS
jgi:hypothetical protein